MNSAFSGLLFGLLGAIVLIYLLIVVNFQSWTDPFVIITALPAALAGIVWMLFATGHHAVGAGADRRDHVHGRGDRELACWSSASRASGCDELGDPIAAALEAGFVALPPGADDGAGDDHRHGADGARPRRGRRAERAARPRRDRRPDLRDHRDADVRARRLQHGPQEAEPAPRRRRRTGDLHGDLACPLRRRRSRAASSASPASSLGCAAAAVVVDRHHGARARADAELQDWTDAQAVPTVAVACPDARALNPTLDLPGRLEAYSRAPIFARVSGYLKSWSADIGARVKAGQVIAEIEAPDLDQQLLQARADLQSQQSSAKLSEATLNRRKQLLASNFVSQQDIDERTADFNNKTSAVNSGQANVERLEALASYKNITAPFDGVVTERNTDVGALINAGGARRADVRRVRHREAARLRQRAADLRAVDQDRREGRHHGAGISEPHLPATVEARRSRSMRRPARRGCNWRSTIRRAS